MSRVTPVAVFMRSRCYRGIVQLATFLLPSVLGSVSFGSSLGFDAIVPTDGCGVRELRSKDR